MAKVSMGQWIASALLDDVRGKCSGMALMHAIGSSHQEVYGIRFEQGQWDPEKLAKTFLHRAEVASQEAHNPQLFYLYAYYDGSPEAQNKFPFRVQGGADEGDVTEEATPKGQLQQTMRHSESVLQTAIRSMQFMVAQQHEFINTLATQNRLLMSENAVAAQTMQKVILDTAAHNHEFAMKEIQARQGAKNWDRIMTLLPAGINALAGKEVIPLPAEDSSTLEALIDAASENPKLIDILAANLRPEVMAVLAQRAERRNEEKKKAQASAEKALATVPGHQDALGGPGAAALFAAAVTETNGAGTTH